MKTTLGTLEESHLETKTQPFCKAIGRRTLPRALAMRNRKRLVSRMSALVALLPTLLFAPSFPGRAQDAAIVWNEIMQNTVTPLNPFFQARASAITQLAVYEAVNAIVGEYEPYIGIDAPLNASPEAAAISAAHAALVGLAPDNQAQLDASRDAALAAIPDGPAKASGVAVGQMAASALLGLRADDGAAEALTTPYTPGTEPGQWRPMPPPYLPAFLPGWGLVTPFALETASQFRPPPPPSLDSGVYAIDYNEVKLMGRIDSPFRPPDRANVAVFYARTSPVHVWNLAARQASMAQGKTLSENARIFALLAMAICDASIATFEAKFYYDLWRPVTAIRDGALDGNNKTQPDGEWLPLILVPPFPSYPSAHGTSAGAARVVLERAYGKLGHNISISNPLFPQLVFHYTRWTQICDDIDDARVFGGIHFRFDQDAGNHLGQDVGKFVVEGRLRVFEKDRRFER